ncbi:MAG: choice-of-anchor tandem repeat GloVer-containing protein, partial [Candidatus Cybelea sp.]
GCGTVYSVRPGGAEKVLYRFSGGSDGSDPDAALVEVGGVLYGTTANGGGSGCAGSGCGTVYSISTTGAETVLHSFGGSPDGATPVAALINVRGVLYGTTFYGGDGSGSGGYVGRGTVFTLTP